MSAEGFLDTNVFVYQLDTGDRRKSEIARRLIGDGIRNGSYRTSPQVVQETLNIILRKAEIPLDEQGARRYLNTILAPLCDFTTTKALYHSALDLRQRFRFHFYDSLIVAAALEAGCRRLISEDFQHGQRIDSLVIENPFLP